MRLANTIAKNLDPRFLLGRWLCAFPRCYRLAKFTARDGDASWRACQKHDRPLAEMFLFADAEHRR